MLPKDAGEIELFSLTWGHETTEPAVKMPQARPTRTVPRAATDEEKERFLEDAFVALKTLFQSNLREMEVADPDHVKAEIIEHSPTKILPKVYVDGNSKAQCKIWFNIGSEWQGRDIFYACDTLLDMDNDTSYNESISIEDDGRELSLKPLGMSFMVGFDDRDGNLDAQTAAEHLWRLFESNITGRGW